MSVSFCSVLGGLYHRYQVMGPHPHSVCDVYSDSVFCHKRHVEIMKQVVLKIRFLILYKMCLVHRLNKYIFFFFLTLYGFTPLTKWSEKHLWTSVCLNFYNLTVEYYCIK